MSYTTDDGTSYRIADAHAHIYKEKIADKASHVIGEFYDVTMAVDAAISANLLKQGAKIGTDVYLVCSAATARKQVEGINEFVAEECAKHPEFVGLGTSHQDVEDVDAVLDRIVELGLKGVKLHPDFQHFNIDDKELLPLYRGCAERGLIVLFHVGDHRPEINYSAPERLARVIDLVPDMKVHAAHFGCCHSLDKRPRALDGYDGLMYDTSSSFAWHDKETVLRIMDEIGLDKLMWGTDYPMWNHTDELERFFALGLSEEDNRRVLYDNFARFYGV